MIFSVAQIVNYYRDHESMYCTAKL